MLKSSNCKTQCIITNYKYKLEYLEEEGAAAEYIGKRRKNKEKSGLTRRTLRRKNKQDLETYKQQFDINHETGQVWQFFRETKILIGNKTNIPRFIKEANSNLQTVIYKQKYHH